MEDRSSKEVEKEVKDGTSEDKHSENGESVILICVIEKQVTKVYKTKSSKTPLVVTRKHV